MSENYFVYILASRRNGTIYVGVTNNLVKRIFEHKSGAIEGFTKKYDVKSLVYFEIYLTAEEAIHREKCIKKWKRGWKIELIEGQNPLWNDLYPSLLK